jgi:hypothetical protein
MLAFAGDRKDGSTSSSCGPHSKARLECLGNEMTFVTRRRWYFDETDRMVYGNVGVLNFNPLPWDSNVR